jgi:hypothetical protein
MFRARQAKQPKAVVCAACRKATWPTRAAARARMKEIEARPNWSPPPGWTANVYLCASGSGWHWGHTKAS